MTTANVKTPFKQPTTRAELQELKKKVRESNTYAHSWYVSRSTLAGNVRDGFRSTHNIVAANLTKAEAIERMHRLETAAANSTIDQRAHTYYDVANPYDDYYRWIQFGGQDGGRIGQWYQIQLTAWNSPQYDERQWD